MDDQLKIFKAYDVRGLVPDELDERKARAIGWSFARLCMGTGGIGPSVASTTPAQPLPPPLSPAGVAPEDSQFSRSLVIARDMRQSGDGLASQFAAGAMAAGMNVVDMGMASTDMLYFVSGHLDMPAAMFTASHNPAAYNGIKLCYRGARPVGQETGLALVKEMAQEALAHGSDGGKETPGTHLERIDMMAEYVDHVLSFVDVGTLRELVVVADVANGMGGMVVPEVFSKLPLKLHMLYPELDGSFPNHPADPIQEENLADLKRAVINMHADIGLAFDGDADRVFLVDENAQPVSGSVTTALVATRMLSKFPGSTILYNIICSKAVPETIIAMGGVPVRTRVGHSFIKKVMAETGAVFGGEHSGHYYFRDNYRADSGLIAALIILELMSVSSSSLSELLEPFRQYKSSGEINTKVDNPAGVVAAVAARLSDSGVQCDLTDGLTVDYGGWWFNLRPSNTEPLLRLNVETSGELEIGTCVDMVKHLIEEVS
ncbi:MAG: phosphomannomutase/phosphoglucomutase [Actinobacteria bacterium]|jgi:phosphomannomutase|nr:phosphomannomutase/phosphoglucomutase [Actinomycetota bacterium]